MVWLKVVDLDFVWLGIIVLIEEIIDIVVV